MTHFSLSSFQSNEILNPYKQSDITKEKSKKKAGHKARKNTMTLPEGCLTCMATKTPLIRQKVFCNRCGIAISRKVRALPEDGNTDAKWQILNIIASVAHKELYEGNSSTDLLKSL